MANYNKVILVGNLTRDPQLRYLPSQMAVVDFGLAVNHRFRTKTGEDREEVCFIDCSAFGKGAEIINQYCTKGRPLLVEGRLKYDTWEDKQGGGKRSKHVVVVDNFQLLGGRGDAPGGPGAPGAPSYDQDAGDAGPPARSPRPPVSRGPAKPAPAPQPPFGEEENFKDEDIPF
ncbi:MAG TPA: single-stranded DNA-binding protein [Tepidisphaeraceae bacterium]|jgi:single-strand DNA-binding protein|nr:single-stranded DNA-binding protein [Tepidisphaeraceae bacterium]